MTKRMRVAVVGGGLAGLAAAVALAEHGLQVDLFEARRRLGGRASSFSDPASDQLIDYCQHVSMGCCTNLADFCRRLKIDDRFERIRSLKFVGPDAQVYDVRASRLLPAPMHLLPSLLRLSYLSRRDRWQIVRALVRLARCDDDDGTGNGTMGCWLRSAGQSPQAIARFWDVVLVSALGESIEHVSMAAARKVFVDGFLAHREGYEVLVPKVPLGELYGPLIASPLRDLGIDVHLNCPVRRIECGSGEPLQSATIRSLTLGDGSQQPFDYAILATSWRHAASLLPDALLSESAGIAEAAEWQTSPITGIHLWFDRPITELRHAVLVDRLSQWLFYRGVEAVPWMVATTAHYYQVVVSASHDLVGVDHRILVDRVCSELRSIWPAAEETKLLHSQVVTQRDAVFSPVPGLNGQRPSQRTSCANLMLAGDWTATGWPATMEGAVRSGYLAAEAVLAASGRPERLVVDDLGRSWLSRLLVGSRS
jgi:squalene-associated FAD-dependent desaturase